MKKNIKKIFIVLALFLILFSILTILNKTHATSLLGGKDAEYFKPSPMTDANEIKNTGNKIIGYVQIIGVVVSVIALGIIGIKYMLGSVEEKAEYKKTMIPYLIGAFTVFGLSTILGIINKFANIFG